MYVQNIPLSVSYAGFFFFFLYYHFIPLYAYAGPLSAAYSEKGVVAKSSTGRRGLGEFNVICRVVGRKWLHTTERVRTRRCRAGGRLNESAREAFRTRDPIKNTYAVHSLYVRTRLTFIFLHSLRCNRPPVSRAARTNRYTALFARAKP